MRPDVSLEALLAAVCLRACKCGYRLPVLGWSTTSNCIDEGRRADIVAAGRNDRLVEEVVSRISLHHGVSAASWKIVSM
jgi:hypothetical protein